MSLLLPKRRFASLSVKDLLDAREAYHTHLLHLENVIVRTEDSELVVHAP